MTVTRLVALNSSDALCKQTKAPSVPRMHTHEAVCITYLNNRYNLIQDFRILVTGVATGRIYVYGMYTTARAVMEGSVFVTA